MLTETELKDLKVGDKVIVSGGGLYSTDKVREITRMTKTLIIVDNMRFNHRGWQTGTSSYHSFYIEPATPESLKDLEERQQRKRKAEEDKQKEVQDHKAFINSIDWKPLEDKVTKVLNLSEPIKFNVKVTDRGYLELESTEDFKNKAGVLSPIFDELRVGNFGSGFGETKEKFWVSIHFWYTFKNSGSNGAKLFDAWYNKEEKTWGFSDDIGGI